MGEIKPWQLIVIAAAVLVLGYSGWSFVSNQGIDQIDGIMAVDVTSGQLYDVRKGRARGMAFPITHPETGERVLYPVEKNGTGGWVLIERYTTSMPEELRENSVIRGTIEFDALDATPIKHVIKP